MAYLGVLLALNQLILLATILLRTNTLFLLGGAALIIGIVIFEYGIKIGSVFYLASCILGFILIPDKLMTLNYCVFFGLYALIKYLIEQYCLKKNKTGLSEVVIKLVFFNTILIMAYFALRLLLFDFTTHFAFILLIGEVIFWIYDYAFGLFIHFYVTKLRVHLPF